MDQDRNGQESHIKSSPTLTSFPDSKNEPDPLVALEDPGLIIPPLPPRDAHADTHRSPQPKQPPEAGRKTAARKQKHLSIDTLNIYDLFPPPPACSHASAEYLAERLFSADHLHIILKDQNLTHRFASFLNTYRPQLAPTLTRYLKAQKALVAIRYANALADQTAVPSRRPSNAAIVDGKFDLFWHKAMDDLVSEALPAYITYRMVHVVTECLVKEITGTIPPLMQELVHGLAEVYCLSDPSFPDNPIVFASEGGVSSLFYHKPRDRLEKRRLTKSRRVLQNYPVWHGICSGQELQVSPRTQDSTESRYPNI